MANRGTGSLNDAPSLTPAKLFISTKQMHKFIQIQNKEELQPAQLVEVEIGRPTCGEQLNFTEFTNAEEILVVDDVEGEVLIDGRDENCEEGADSIQSRESEDEMTEEATLTTGKTNIPKKRRRRRKDIEEEKSYEEHHYGGKSKRKNGRKSLHQNISKQNRTYSENSVFECELCQRRFSNKFFLDRHFMTHTGEKPYGCDICELRFNQKQNLDRHLLTHTGQKPFSCNICKAEFNQRANLNRHVLTHTGEQPFKCNICHLTFNQKANLNRHYLRHTGETPFQCHLCDAKFIQKVNLIKHFQRHAEKKTKPSKDFDLKVDSETPFYLVYVGE